MVPAVAGRRDGAASLAFWVAGLFARGGGLFGLGLEELERAAFVDGDVVGLVALDEVLRVVLGGVMDVALVVVAGDDFFEDDAADEAGFGIPFDMVAGFEGICHARIMISGDASGKGRSFAHRLARASAVIEKREWEGRRTRAASLCDAEDAQAASCGIFHSSRVFHRLPVLTIRLSFAKLLTKGEIWLPNFLT